MNIMLCTSRLTLILVATAFASALSAAPALAQARGDSAADLMSKMDVDKDGKVSKAEYTLYRDSIFNTLDRNKNGDVTHDEMVQGARGDFARMQGMRFGRTDTNRDGKVDKAEFGKQTEDLFTYRDANKDGVLTVEELGALGAGRGRGGPGRGMGPGAGAGAGPRGDGPGAGAGPRSGGGPGQGRGPRGGGYGQ